MSAFAALATRRCQRHITREAVGRCPLCQGFFCRECVVEHDDSIICSACLAKVSVVQQAKRSRFGWIPRMLGASAGCGILMIIFYTMGRLLVSTPSSFHEGTVWKESFWSDLDEDSPEETTP